jgi:hypothetical protein
VKTKEQIEEGLKELEGVFAQCTEPLHVGINIDAQVMLPSKEDGTLRGTVAMNCQHVVEDLERIIRATEICTLKWVLGLGGGLNTLKWEIQDATIEEPGDKDEIYQPPPI